MFDIIETTFQSKALEDIFKVDFLNKVYADVRVKALNFESDLETEKGRKEIASQAYKVAQSKSFIEKHGKKYSGQLKASAKIVDKARKTFRDNMDGLRDEIRQPLTEWEESEKNRLEAEALTIEIAEDHEEAVLMNDEFDKQIKAALELKAKLEEIRLKEIAVQKREAEIRAEAERIRREDEIRKEAEEAALSAIKAAQEVEKARQEEAKKETERIKQAAIAEGARVKREAAEEVARQAEERKRLAKEAEEAKLRAVREAEELAERQRLEREAERKAAEELKAWEEAEEKKRVDAQRADKQHREEIRMAAITCFEENNYQYEEAKEIVKLIESKMIDFVRIQF